MCDDLSFQMFPSICKSTNYEDTTVQSKREFDLIMNERKKFRNSIQQNVTSRSKLILKESAIFETEIENKINTSRFVYNSNKKTVQMNNSIKLKTNILNQNFNKQKQVLIIYDSNFKNCNSIYKIQYCISYLPQKKEQFLEWINSIKSYLNVHNKKDYLFNKNGDHITDIMNFWENTIFLSPSIFFQGVKCLNDLNFIPIFQDFLEKLENQVSLVNSNKKNQAQHLQQFGQKQKTLKTYINKIENIKADIAHRYLDSVFDTENIQSLQTLENDYDIDKVDNAQRVHFLNDLIKKEYKYENKSLSSDKQKFFFQKKSSQNNKSKDFVQANKKNQLNTYRSIINRQQHTNQELFIKNIPSILQGNLFTRAELYQFYILFKILCICTAIQNKNSDQEINGIDFDAYYGGITENFVKGEEYSKITFNNLDKFKKGIFDQQRLFKLKIIPRSYIFDEKQDFRKQNRNTTSSKLKLTKDEILNICKLSLENFIKNKELLDEMSNFFTQYIFNQLNINQSCDVVDMKQLKDHILQNNEEIQQILSVFFGV